MQSLFEAKPVTEPAGGNECKECGAYGFTVEQRVTMGDRISNKEDQSWAQCAQLCDENLSCESFSYHAELKKCYLQKVSSGPSFFKARGQ